MNKNQRIYTKLLEEFNRSNHKLNYGDNIHMSYYNEIEYIDIETISKQIYDELYSSTSDWAFYTSNSNIAISFIHGNLYEGSGCTEMFAIKSGMTIEENLFATISYDLDYQQAKKDIGIHFFKFSFAKNWFDYTWNKTRDIKVIDGDTSELEDVIDSFGSLNRYIKAKAYLGIHLALKRLCTTLDFPENMPFVIEEHDYGSTHLIYVNEK